MEKRNIGARIAIYPVPLYLVGTYDRKGKPNVMTVGWGGVCCSVPPCLSVSVRKETHTYDALMERRAFTVNLPSAEFAGIVSYVGSVSGKDENKFDKCGITPERSEFVDAPYIKEMPVNLECSIIQIHEIGSHVQFVGEIINVKIDDNLSEGVPYIEQCPPIVYAVGNNNRYYSLGDPVKYESIV